MDEAEAAAAPVAPEAAAEEEEAEAAPATPQAEAAEPTAAAPEPEGGEAEASPVGPEDERPAEGLPSSSETDQEPPPAEGEAEEEPVAAEEEGPASPEAVSSSQGPPEAEPEEGGGPPTSEGPGGEAAAAAAKEEEEEEVEVVLEVQEAKPPSPPPSPPPPPLPTHVTFTTGELPDLLLGADLTERRLSLSLRALDQRRASAGSLGVGSSTESEEEPSAARLAGETEEQLAQRLAHEQARREELAERYRQLAAERVRARHYNAKLQSKLADVLNKAKGPGGQEAAAARAELEQHISDREQRYARYLAMRRELRREQEAEGAWFRLQTEGLRRSCDQKLAAVEAEWKAHQAIKKEVAVFTMGRRLGGRQAAVKEVDQIQGREQSKEDEVTAVRLENIKLKHMIQKLEASLRVQEMLAEGLHLIDFEQLKIENQTYNEKIEERNEELLKLRRRITNTVQILSQVKEKLQFVEAENQEKQAELMAIEAYVAQKREILTKTKQARDKLRMDNQRLYQKCGLLGNTLLLRDFENKVHTAEELNEKLDLLKQRHAVLTHTCKGVKKKIRGVKNFLAL